MGYSKEDMFKLFNFGLQLSAGGWVFQDEDDVKRQFEDWLSALKEKKAKAKEAEDRDKVFEAYEKTGSSQVVVGGQTHSVIPEIVDFWIKKNKK